MTNERDICPICGGQKSSGLTTFSADLGSGVVVVRDVKATICNQCGEEWIDNVTAEQLEKITTAARGRGLQVEVLAMA